MNPSSGVVFQYKPKEGAEELIYQRISDITISMKALDYLNMPDCIPTRYEVEMNADERKLYDMLMFKQDMSINCDDLGKLCRAAEDKRYTLRNNAETLQLKDKLAESLNQKYGEGAVFINKVVINNMDFEEAYNTAIQQKSIAQQNADKQKIENEAAIAKAEADKQVAITNAEAEAQKTSIAADAQAEANRKIAESLSDTLIEYQKIQKWDGKLPTVSGSNALVSIDPAE